MSDVVDGLKSLSLHGMASAWPEVLGTARIKALDHEVVLHQLIKSEAAQREVRSMAYQMRIARFPAHRDLTGFDFAQAHVDASLVKQLHELQFVDSAHNVVFVGGAGHGQDALGDQPWGASHPSQRQAGAFLLHGGTGQCLGA